MTERLADISARIENVRQLASVVTAMRGIAASRAQQSRNLLAGIEAYSETVSTAIGDALGFVASPARSVEAPGGGQALIVFCAEQGFAGGLSDSVLKSAGTIAPSARLIVVGSRGGSIAAERGLAVTQTIAMAAQIGALPGIANLIAETLYAHVAAGTITRAGLVYPRVDGGRDLRMERVALFPLELEKFRHPHAAVPPLTTLAPGELLERLAAEYVYARLCEAAMHAFAAENQMRMETMSAASNNIDRTLDELRHRENQVRQENVTAEIVELAATGRELR